MTQKGLLNFGKSSMKSKVAEEMTPLSATSLPLKPSKLNDRKNNSEVQKPPPTFAENLSYYYSEYAGATSFHGVQYTGERGRYILEKIFWVIIITLVWIGCIFLISRTYYKWKTSPVIVTFSTIGTPISQIPFPAVTVCPEVKCSSSVFNLTEVMLKLHDKGIDSFSKEEQDNLRTLFLICDGFIMELMGDIIGGGEDVAVDVDKRLWKLNKPILRSSDLGWSMNWLHKEVPLNDSQLFLTEAGFCYTFNNLHSTEILRNTPTPSYITSDIQKAKGWSFEGGYTDSASIEVYPRRTFASGLNGGVAFQIPTDFDDIEYICGRLQGFKVMIHHPSERPTLDAFFQLPLDTACNVAVIPRMITVSEALKNHLPSDRKCYYSHEKHLKYFKLYTQNNCVEECIVNYTVKHCECAAFYMPRSGDTPICKSSKRKCVDESRTTYSVNESGLLQCDCLPTCTWLQYDIEISQTPWSWLPFKTLFKTLNLTYQDTEENFDRLHYSALNIYFKDYQFLASERNELYGYVDFFSNTGGLLGLFIGFSVTSAIEIVYFMTLRLVCNIKKYGKQYWAGESIVEASSDE